MSAVSNAGDLGGFGAYTLSPREIYEADKKLKTATNKPYNINFWVSDTDAVNGTVSDEQFEKTKALYKPYFDEVNIPLPEKPAIFAPRFENQVNVILYIRPKVFSFMFGIPSQDILEESR
ncbi:nitronate monooxygenase [Flavobacterium sp. P21]|uniref:nitronate monooxygenase n=1 Tax=Flavobacterium sp. P21 TaxID=3423948 RepID=UPI003D67A51F